MKIQLARLWDAARDAQNSGNLTEAIQLLRVIAKRCPQERHSAREALLNVASMRSARRHHPEEPELISADPAEIDNMIPMCPSDVWAWRAIEDPLNEIGDWRDEAEELFLDEWAREIAEGTDDLAINPLAKQLERKWLVKLGDAA